MKTRIMLAAILMLGASPAGADEREAYNRRAADADMAVFRQLDLNGDGVLAREEARGDVHFGARFNDIDINRDGTLTPAEMRRYIEQTYGVRPAS